MAATRTLQLVALRNRLNAAVLAERAAAVLAEPFSDRENLAIRIARLEAALADARECLRETMSQLAGDRVGARVGAAKGLNAIDAAIAAFKGEA